ncbi:MAG TPA: hypothetical protein VF142_08470 [Longimicrobium sp.]
MDGNRILGEVPGELGLLLWGTARDVALWGGSPAGERGNLFADGSGDERLAGLVATEVPVAISASVDTIHGMLTLGGRADASVLCICCLEVAAWAHGGGFPETAIAFAQAGAVAAPEFGEAALHTGIYALRAGQVARAGTWLRRAVGVSRRERNRPAYASALVELGALYEGGGRVDQAERFFRLGYTAGKRYAARNARMRAAHGLFRLARARGDAASAAQFALAAQRVYEPDAGGGPALLLDLARFWIDEGQPDRARSALRRLAPARGLLAPGEQLASSALAARAFAVPGSRRKGLATASAAVAWGVMADAAIAEGVRFAAALDLAHGARIVCDLVAFTRAKRAVLTLAPQATYPAVAAEVAELWPDGEKRVRTMERAS